MLQGVLVALGSAAAGAVHPADLIASNRGRSASFPAPLAHGAASQRLVHRPVHGVEPPFFFHAPTPSVGAMTLPGRPRRGVHAEPAAAFSIGPDRSSGRRECSVASRFALDPKASEYRPHERAEERGSGLRLKAAVAPWSGRPGRQLRLQNRQTAREGESVHVTQFLLNLLVSSSDLGQDVTSSLTGEMELSMILGQTPEGGVVT